MTSIVESMFRNGGYAVLALCMTLAPAVADTVSIKLKSGPNRFEPTDVTVKAGDTIVWTNEAGRHTVTPDDDQPDPFKGSDEFTPTLPNNTYQVVIGGAPRTIKYHCEVHGPMMSGQIVVTAAADPTPTPSPTAAPTATPTPSPTATPTTK